MILRPTDGPQDWKEFLAQPERQWKAGYSAMETAFSWEAQIGLPPEIANLFPKAEMLFAIPEYKVPIPGGARDSQNDLFVLLRDKIGLVACMVEAKRNEPFGPTLDEWLHNASQNKKTRIASICRMLGLKSEHLDGSLRYQLFHRTASAVLTAKLYHTHRAAVVVQSFSPEHRWFDDFTAFAGLLGLSPDVDDMAMTKLPGGIEISLGWASCQPATTGTEAL